MSKLSSRHCPICSHSIKKNGRTRKGATRWRCTACGMSFTKKREDITHAAQFDKFIHWIMGNRTQREACPSGSDRTWRHRIEWCWTVKPELREFRAYLTSGLQAYVLLSLQTLINYIAHSTYCNKAIFHSRHDD